MWWLPHRVSRQTHATRLIESSGVNLNFRLLGLIPHAHIPALMRSSAALINPSTFEGWSTTVEEAKAMGTPMILSDLKVHQEQSKEASFFNATAPVQLADILENFSPVNPEQRLFMSTLAAEQSSASMQKFAQEFVTLMGRTATHA
jgi:glycosyltransferase involved in cell wall biosynthesis